MLAPTGSDLGGPSEDPARHLGRVFAGYHYDLNLFTLHGQSRYPGLFVVRGGGLSWGNRWIVSLTRNLSIVE